MILAIYGAGAMGREIKIIADKDKSFPDIVFIDDNASGELSGSRIYRFREFRNTFSPGEVSFVTGMGEPRFRKEAYEKMKQAGYTGAFIRHPSAAVIDDAVFGEDIVLGYGVFVGSGVRIGNSFHAANNACIGHDAVIGDYVRIGAGAFVGGHSEILDNAYVGAGAMIKDRIRIGASSVLALGAVALADLPDNATAIGNPARIIDESRSGMLYSSSYEQAADAGGKDKKKTVYSPDVIAERYWEVFSKVFSDIDFNPVTFRFHDSGWDSVTQMELIAGLEEQFQISIKGRDSLKLNSFQSGLNIVKKKLAQKQEQDG
ncbi:MAG: hypothetical protein IIZ75_08265 [Lachnospiraceae bacterium]|nr:hypothetical protein [Lachnospiraceae bacterium]